MKIIDVVFWLKICCLLIELTTGCVLETKMFAVFGVHEWMYLSFRFLINYLLSFNWFYKQWDVFYKLKYFAVFGGCEWMYLLFRFLINLINSGWQLVSISSFFPSKFFVHKWCSTALGPLGLSRREKKNVCVGIQHLEKQKYLYCVVRSLLKSFIRTPQVTLYLANILYKKNNHKFYTHTHTYIYIYIYIYIYKVVQIWPELTGNYGLKNGLKLWF